MKQSESIANLATALVAVQGHVSPVIKDRQNPHFKNNYATLDAIMENVRLLLAGHGLSVIQGGAGPVSNNDGNIVGVSVETVLVHTSGEWVTSTFVLPIEKPSAQAVGSAITYGRRYGISALLALSTEEDDDGQIASQPPKAARPAPAKAAPAPRRSAADIHLPGTSAKLNGHGGKRIGDMTTADLTEVMAGLKATGKFADIIENIGEVLADRASAAA